MSTGSGRARHAARLATLAFLRDGDGVLLMRRPPDADRFAGLWNGIGGHVEAGEDICEAALRELREEAGVAPARLCLRGVIHESGLLGHATVVFVFVGEAGSRAVAPSLGVELAWHPVAALGGLPLVEDLRALLPRVLAADEPLFVTERYDGRDGCLALRIGGVEARPESCVGR